MSGLAHRPEHRLAHVPASRRSHLLDVLHQPISARAFRTALLLSWAVGSGAIILASLFLCSGVLIYALDDPYLHLALAENILRGTYGVNLDDPSSPSSSIIYPLLLVITEAVGLKSAGPLALNTVATAASVVLLADFILADVLRRRGSNGFATIFGVGALLLLNAFGLPMTGMEHSLHVLLCLVTLVGLIRTCERNRTPWLAVVGILGMPLVRFEGLAFSGAAILVLLAIGRIRAGLGALLGLVACLAAYGWAMWQLGLPLLPSSVTTKSAIAGRLIAGRGIDGVVAAAVENFYQSVNTERFGLVLAAGLIVVLVAMGRCVAVRRWRDPRILVGGAVASMSLAHLFAGRYGWFARYEVYAISTVASYLLYCHRDFVVWLVDRADIPVKLGALAIIGLIAFPYVVTSARTPFAAQGIFLQQYQMHRFATQFLEGNVAVNDLGRVSYQNDHFVLDLWGLGSEEVRKARRAGDFDAATIQRLASKHDVRIAMIYEHWFLGIVPTSWCRVATLSTPQGSSGQSRVAFYVQLPLRDRSISDALNRFGETLPPRAKLVVTTCSDAG